jgi:haloalkane dehalogenase
MLDNREFSIQHWESSIQYLAAAMNFDPQTHLADWRAEYPFTSHWVALPGGRMHYVDERPGVFSADSDRSAQTLLFVHGNPTWSFHWRKLIRQLSRQYRCVAPDHLGCGLSDKPAHFLRLDEHIDNLCSLVDKLGLTRLTLVAQDWGGAIGLGAMQHLPDRLERIVLFNTGAFPPRYIPWRIRVCKTPVIGRFAVQGANLFNRAALRMTLARRTALEPAIRAGYLAPYDSWSHRRAVYGFVKDIPRPSHRAHPTWQTLAAIERGLSQFAGRPAALVWGMRDWCFRPDCLERFRNAWPRAEVHALADVGHWVVEDAPEEALTIVERFLGQKRIINHGVHRVHGEISER